MDGEEIDEAMVEPVYAGGLRAMLAPLLVRESENGENGE